MDFTGRRVLVTAGGDGIGRGIATAFLQRGATVVVTDVVPDSVRAAQSAGLDVRLSDAADERAVSALMAGIEAELGGLDILVNNAGIAGPTGPVEQLETDAWLRTFDVNVHSQFYAVKHGLPLLRRSSAPAIVNMSSAAGRLGMPLRTPYSASKWAVVGFTKSLAIELGPEGIRVNAICPGAVDGPRIRAVMAAKAESLGVPIESIAERTASQASMGTLIDVEDIANAVLFVCSDLAGKITGQALAVDGNTDKLF